MDFDGAGSVVRETWQEPPPCTAEPVKESVCGSPIFAVLAALMYLIVGALQGKSAPAPSRGLLLRASGSNGAGVFNFMWPLTEDKRSVMAAARPKEYLKSIMVRVEILPEDRCMGWYEYVV